MQGGRGEAGEPSYKQTQILALEQRGPLCVFVSGKKERRRRRRQKEEGLEPKPDCIAQYYVFLFLSVLSI